MQKTAHPVHAEKSTPLAQRNNFWSFPTWSISSLFGKPIEAPPQSSPQRNSSSTPTFSSSPSLQRTAESLELPASKNTSLQTRSLDSVDAESKTLHIPLPELKTPIGSVTSTSESAVGISARELTSELEKVTIATNKGDHTPQPDRAKGKEKLFLTSPLPKEEPESDDEAEASKASGATTPTPGSTTPTKLTLQEEPPSLVETAKASSGFSSNNDTKQAPRLSLQGLVLTTTPVLGIRPQTTLFEGCFNFVLNTVRTQLTGILTNLAEKTTQRMGYKDNYDTPSVVEIPIGYVPIDSIAAPLQILSKITRDRIPSQKQDDRNAIPDVFAAVYTHIEHIIFNLPPRQQRTLFDNLVIFHNAYTTYSLRQLNSETFHAAAGAVASADFNPLQQWITDATREALCKAHVKSLNNKALAAYREELIADTVSSEAVSSASSYPQTILIKHIDREIALREAVTQLQDCIDYYNSPKYKHPPSRFVRPSEYHGSVSTLNRVISKLSSSDVTEQDSQGLFQIVTMLFANDTPVQVTFNEHALNKENSLCLRNMLNSGTFDETLHALPIPSAMLQTKKAILFRILPKES